MLQYNYIGQIISGNRFPLTTKGNLSNLLRLHERALRLVYNDYCSTFQHLLEKDDSCTVHHSNLHFLSIQLYKVVNDLTTNIFSNIILRNNQGVSLHSQNEFALPQVRTESCGKGASRYLGPLIWNIIPSEIKNLSSLKEFKKQIRQCGGL